jgi:hypothetical protein
MPGVASNRRAAAIERTLRVEGELITIDLRAFDLLSALGTLDARLNALSKAVAGYDDAGPCNLPCHSERSEESQPS